MSYIFHLMRYGLEGKIFRVARPIHWRNTCSRRMRAFLSRFKKCKKNICNDDRTREEMFHATCDLWKCILRLWRFFPYLYNTSPSFLSTYLFLVFRLYKCGRNGARWGSKIVPVPISTAIIHPNSQEIACTASNFSWTNMQIVKQDQGPSGKV